VNFFVNLSARSFTEQAGKAARLLHPTDDPEPTISLSLRQALKRSDQNVRVPETFDATVIASARLALARGRLRRRTLRLAGAGAALVSSAAAAILVIALRSNPGTPTPSTAGVRHVAIREDLDGNGKVDILDAFYLARQLQGDDRRNVRVAHDVNSDGAVDRRDVDAIARVAVSVGGRA
jgi:hypothetical protein